MPFPTTHSLPSLNALKAFQSAARRLSFSKAADELNVTPAAISLRIRSLKEHLGVELFHRLRKGIALTDAGVSALPDLQLGFCRLTKAVERLRGGEETRLLAVQSAPSFAAKWLAPRPAGVCCRGSGYRRHDRRKQRARCRCLRLC